MASTRCGSRWMPVDTDVSTAGGNEMMVRDDELTGRGSRRLDVHEMPAHVHERDAIRRAGDDHRQ